jgi:predicted ATP-grasp superfamily ATP-dependent carboligase/RimJ/RimL family protein N-acetyltransferase
MTYKCLKANHYKDQDGYELLPIRDEDKELIRNFRNSQIDILRQMKPISEEEQKLYFEKVITPSFSQDFPAQILFSFRFQEKFIGYGGLTHIDWCAKRAEVSFLLDPKIEEASAEFSTCFSHFLTLLLQISFDEIKFHKLTAEAYEFRPQLPTILEEFGFTLEGRLVDHVCKGEKLHSSLLYGLLNKPRPEHKAVLVTSISKKVPLLRAVKQAALKTGYGQVIGADINENVIGKYWVSAFWKCPKTSEMTFRDVLEYCKKNNVTTIVPTRDHELPFFAGQKQALEKEGIHVMISEPKTVDICLDKKLFADFLLEHSLPFVETCLTYEECIATEYVVKERFGAGSQKLGLKLKPHDAKLHAKTLQSPIFQPYIPGKEYSIDIYRSLEKKVHGIVVRERNLVVDGESQITTTVHNTELEMLAEKTCDLLNIYGSAVIQIIVGVDGKPYILECNPRFGGASSASISAGLDSFYWFLLECNGESLSNYPFKRLEFEIRQIRYATDKAITWTKK